MNVSSLGGDHDRSDSIIVTTDNDMLLSSSFSLQSPWVEMSGRKVRYYTDVPFEKQTYINMWALEVEDVVTLLWDGKMNTIRYQEGKQFTSELLVFWVLHTFYPLVLELSKIYHILHVSSVQLNEKVVLFSAFSGGGKSTLLNYFLNKGHRIYGDDTLAIQEENNSYNVIASYPFHRPYREVESLGYPIANFAQEVLPLSQMYVLEKAELDAQVLICELRGVEKFEALYQSKFITFEYLKKERFLFATQMAKRVKVYKIMVPWDRERLEEVYQAIITHNAV